MPNLPGVVLIRSGIRIAVFLLMTVALPRPTLGQNRDSLTGMDKLRFHAASTYSPWAIAASAASAGVGQKVDAPTEWGQGASGYGKRFGSIMASSGIQSTLAFGLDSALHQDPRYFRRGGEGFWRRSAHALRGTLLTHTDRGGETVSTWRIGSAYGAAFLSNQWYPSRLNTVGLGFAQGSVSLAFGLASNLGAEFGPDIKRKVLRRK